jgi:DNA-3-methyladenine glycosylase
VLDRAFYERPAIPVARALLGCTLVHVDAVAGVTRKARIVETEAYVGERDLASHSSKGRTARTAVMFGPPGHVYVYLIYGMHWCFNVVTERDGKAAAVLIRAAAPLQDCDGHLSGPGALCRGMHFDRRHYGMDLCGNTVFVEQRATRPHIVASPRVNVDYAGEWALKPWRFAIDQEPLVSRPRPFRIEKHSRHG